MASQDFAVDRDLRLIERLAASLGRVPEQSVIERLGRYVELVARWNRTINLTAAREAGEQVEVLLADALALVESRLVPENARLVDIGSGAGAPAVPLKLLRDDLTVLLVEPRRKRAAFLRTALGTLNLMRSVQVREQRIDPRHPWLEGLPFDVAISRAAFPPEVWAAVGARLAPLTLVLTAQHPPPEPPAESRRAESYAYRLPGSGAARRVTVYRS